MTTDPDRAGELMLVTLADARLPTGSHTQSAGVEPALRGGLTPARIPDYLATRLRTVTRVEAATAVVARHVVLATSDRAAGARAAGDPADGAGDGSGSAASTAAEADLAAARDAWAARTPSDAVRAASEQLGRGYLRLLRRLWPGHPAGAALAELGRPPRPLVLGAVAACAGLSPAQTVRLVGYEDAQSVASATLKLAPLDPVTTTQWVLAAHATIDAMAADLAHLTTPAEIPADGAPLMEVWAQEHATATERMFSA